MWWLIPIGLFIFFGAIMCCNLSQGIPPPDKILVFDKYGGLKYKKL